MSNSNNLRSSTTITNINGFKPSLLNMLKQKSIDEDAKAKNTNVKVILGDNSVLTFSIPIGDLMKVSKYMAEVVGNRVEETKICTEASIHLCPAFESFFNAIGVDVRACIVEVSDDE